MSASPGSFGAGVRARRRHVDIPQPTEPFYIGDSFKDPAPPRSMWDEERESPWLVRLYAWAFVASLVGCGVAARSCS